MHQQCRAHRGNIITVYKAQIQTEFTTCLKGQSYLKAGYKATGREAKQKWEKIKDKSTHEDKLCKDIAEIRQ